MKKQKGFVPIILLAIVVLIVVGAGAYYYFTSRKNVGSEMPTNTGIAAEYQVDYQAGATNAPTIKGGADLDKAMADLDNTDLNQIDKDLNALSADSSSF